MPMKITIDTKEDSHDEIRRVIKMLSSLVGEQQPVFTNAPVMEAPAEQKPADDVLSSLFSNEEEKKEEVPRIVEY
jgi:hypothetical protein